jgi:hypothetical protein
VPEVGSSERKPKFSEVLARARSAAAAGMFVALPGAVHKYDATTRKADVQVLVKNAYLDENDARQVESIGIVPSCPVHFPWGYSAPISDGTLVFGGTLRPATTGLLVFCDRSIDRWLSGNGQEVDPEIDHEHHLSDGVFQPGLFTFPKAPAAAQDAVCLGDQQGNDWVALATKVDTLNNALIAAITAAKNAVVAQDGGLAAFTALLTALKPPALTYNWPTSVAASQVKAK